MSFRVRLREPRDDAEWLRMRRALWPHDTKEAHQIDMAAWVARSDAVVLVADRPDGQGLAGFAEVGTRLYADGCDTSPVAYLEGWYVDCDVRRQGIGAALVCAAEMWARERGYHELASDALLNAVESQRAHESLGFIEVERAVRYRKSL
jgi:aminoglycoside 6'-N-acetyltransferase I